MLLKNNGQMVIPCPYNQPSNTSFIIDYSSFIPLHVSFWWWFHFSSKVVFDVLFNLIPPTDHMLEARWETGEALRFVLHPAPVWGWTCLYIDRREQQASLKCHTKGTDRALCSVGDCVKGYWWTGMAMLSKPCTATEPCSSIHVYSELLEILGLCSRPTWVRSGTRGLRAAFMIVYPPESTRLVPGPLLPQTDCVTWGKATVQGSPALLILGSPGGDGKEW